MIMVDLIKKYFEKRRQLKEEVRTQAIRDLEKELSGIDATVTRVIGINRPSCDLKAEEYCAALRYFYSELYELPKTSPKVASLCERTLQLGCSKYAIEFLDRIKEQRLWTLFTQERLVEDCRERVKTSKNPAQEIKRFREYQENHKVVSYGPLG